MWGGGNSEREHTGFVGNLLSVPDGEAAVESPYATIRRNDPSFRERVEVGQDAVICGPAKVPFARAEFGKHFDASGILVFTDPIHCDGPIRNAADLAGAIAVVERDPPQKVVNRIGFIAKARIVQQHGAVGMIVLNTGDDLMRLSSDDFMADIVIPTVIVRQKDAYFLRNASGTRVCISFSHRLHTLCY